MNDKTPEKEEVEADEKFSRAYVREVGLFLLGLPKNQAETMKNIEGCLAEVVGISLMAGRLHTLTITPKFAEDGVLDGVQIDLGDKDADGSGEETYNTEKVGELLAPSVKMAIEHRVLEATQPSLGSILAEALFRKRAKDKDAE